MLIDNISSFLKKNKIVLKKSLGQNFLNNHETLDNLLTYINPTEKDIFIEIGSGIGSLTFPLSRKVKKIYAVETDRNLLKISEKLGEAFENIEFINQDILKLGLEQFIKCKLRDGEKVRITGNLPYYISTPILFELLKVRKYVRDVIIMLQKELAMRMLAHPGTRDYNALTVFLQLYTDIELGFEVKRTCFYPQPKVDSTVVKIIPLARPRVDIDDSYLFEKIVKTCFAHKRKTLKNNLKKINGLTKNFNIIDSIFGELSMNPEIRAEDLSVFDFKRLYDILIEKGLV